MDLGEKSSPVGAGLSAPAAAGSASVLLKAGLMWAVFLGVVVWCTHQPSAWAWFRVDHREPLYLDAYPYLAGAEVAARGGDPYAVNDLDPWHRGHANGPVWLWLGRLGVRSDLAPAAGWLTLVLFAAALAGLYRPAGYWWVAAGLAALLSPGVLLGVERANNDLLLLAWIILAAGLAAQPGWGAKTAALSGVTLAGAAKYHPGAAFVLVLAARNRRQFIRLALSLAVWLGVLLAVLRHDPVFLRGRWPDQGSPGMFGLPGLLVWAGWSHSTARTSGVGLGAVLGVLLLAVRWRRNGWWVSGPDAPWRGLAMLAGYAVLGVSYFAAGNQPYRLVWCLPALAVAMQPAGVLTASGRRFMRLLVAVALANLLWPWLGPRPPASPSLALALGFQAISLTHVVLGLAFVADFAVVRWKWWSGETRGGAQVP